MSDDLRSAIAIAVAALGGTAIGVERQWSGHATGEQARFGGVRTFTLLGAAAGIAGQLWLAGMALAAAALVGGAIALVIAGYVAASRHEVDATTEVAALVVIAAGLLAGSGHIALASGTIALTNLLLIEKSQLHSLVRRIGDVELHAAARFLVMAVVVLPLLPKGPFGPLGGVRPRELWALVLILSGLSFAGYLGRRLVGPRHGHVLAGALGGLVSSTSVALSFARASRAQSASASSLATGVVAASSVMFVRLILVTLALNPPLGAKVAPLLAAPLLTGAAATALGLRREPVATTRTPAGPENPLQFGAALQMAALFQVVLFAVHWVREAWGTPGLIASGAVLGLTDTDALALSMAKSAPQGADLAASAAAIAAGGVSNTALKLGAVLAIGGRRFRAHAGCGLAAIAAAALGAIALFVASGVR